MRLQCTHMYDLAGLLLAHAHHRRDHRRYNSTVVKLDSIESSAPVGWLHAELKQDGEQVLWGDIAEDIIWRPQSCEGRLVERGFREWIESMEEEDAEHAFVLRRAYFVGRSRTVDLSGVRSADEMDFPAVCHAYKPQRRKAAHPMPGSIVRFDETCQPMLSRVHTQP